MSDDRAERVPEIRAIAYYLPQFHPTPENDEWWGPGFTEWVNVARARPLFPGHRQPHLPGELGFYDLRLPETREAQAALARAHGVHGFCYWHYWFGGGQTMLDRPFDEVLSSGEPDFPFCLAWANHTWAGVWQGAPKRVLIEQTYPGPDDDRKHFETLVPALHDPRYIRVDGKPLFVVHQPLDMSDPRDFIERWQSLARDAGLPGLFMVGRTVQDWSPSSDGYDAAVVDQTIPPWRNRLTLDPRADRRLDWILGALSRRTRLIPVIYSYRRWAPYIPASLGDLELSFPTVLPNFDNTPRTGRSGTVFIGTTPDSFGVQVERACQLVKGRTQEHQILFISSWNEWAEGNYLEPDREFGRGRLEAFRDSITQCEASA
jgi:hypothetical protein